MHWYWTFAVSKHVSGTQIGNFLFLVNVFRLDIPGTRKNASFTLRTLANHVGGVKRNSTLWLTIGQVFLFCVTYGGLLVMNIHR